MQPQRPRKGRPKIANPFVWGKHTGWGALQIVGKYDVLDQSDSAFNNAGGCPTTQLFPGLSGSAPALVAPSVSQCGEMKTWLVGANWYLNDYVRLMFDYAQSDLSNFPITTLTATNTTVRPGTKKTAPQSEASTCVHKSTGNCRCAPNRGSFWRDAAILERGRGFGRT
jgi:hypothetical protein